MFLEFNCGYFETKTESLGPSYQKLVFWPYLDTGVAKKQVNDRLEISNIIDISNWFIKKLFSITGPS